MKTSSQIEKQAKTEVIVSCVCCSRRELRPVAMWHIDRCRSSWLRVDLAMGWGVCVDCPQIVKAWDLTKRKSLDESPAMLRTRARVGRVKRAWGIRHARYWLTRKKLRAWSKLLDGPGVNLAGEDRKFLAAIWRGEA